MKAEYSKVLKAGLNQYIKRLSNELNVDQEILRVVVKIERGELGAFLFQESRFVRRIEMVELVDVLMG